MGSNYSQYPGLDISGFIEGPDMLTFLVEDMLIESNDDLRWKVQSLDYEVFSRSEYLEQRGDANFTKFLKFLFSGLADAKSFQIK